MTTLTGSVCSYDAIGLANGTTYYFVIKATNEGGDSTVSYEASAILVPLPGTVKAKHVQLLETSAVDMDTLNQAFIQVHADSKGIKTITTEIDVVTDVNNYMLLLPEEALSGGEGKRKIEIHWPTGTVVVSDNMLKSTKDMNNASQVGIYIGKPDMSRFGNQVNKQVGNSPVIEIKVICKGEEISWKTRNSPVCISIDYVALTEEQRHPDHITVWYVDGKGKINSVKDGVYDTDTGKVSFTVTEF